MSSRRSFFRRALGACGALVGIRAAVPATSLPAVPYWPPVLSGVVLIEDVTMDYRTYGMLQDALDAAKRHADENHGNQSRVYFWERES